MSSHDDATATLSHHLENAEDIDLTLSAFEAFTLLGHVQLALRHPSNHGPAAAVARDLADRLVNLLAPEPGLLREICLQGFDPAHDQETG